MAAVRKNRLANLTRLGGTEGMAGKAAPSGLTGRYGRERPFRSHLSFARASSTDCH
jgi:hypothetical protein